MMHRLRVNYLGIFTVTFLMALSSCKLGRFAYYNFADIGDHKIFASRPLRASGEPFQFHKTEKPKAPRTISLTKDKTISFDQYLENNQTVAFIIIKNDTIQYEKYFKGYNQESIVPSFSMAKSVTSILIGCAIDDGLIGSVDDKVTKYLPELSQNGFDKVTIKHLLQMTSGLKFNESYFNPFGHAASFYYGRNLEKACLRLKLATDPGKVFDYVSGNTQLLGLILQRTLKGKTVTDYLQEKIWTPLGMEYPASWSLDKKKNGLEKTFCCLNARARDFAKIGNLYRNKGKWNGKQIVSANWVDQSTRLDTSDGSAWYYQYQWWLPTKNGDFMAEGILGQFVYVNPAKNLVMVRLGKKHGKVNWGWVFSNIATLY